MREIIQLHIGAEFTLSSNEEKLRVKNNPFNIIQLRDTLEEDRRAKLPKPIVKVIISSLRRMDRMHTLAEIDEGYLTSPASAVFRGGLFESFVSLMTGVLPWGQYVALDPESYPFEARRGKKDIGIDLAHRNIAIQCKNVKSERISGLKTFDQLCRTKNGRFVKILATRSHVRGNRRYAYLKVGTDEYSMFLETLRDILEDLSPKKMRKLRDGKPIRIRDIGDHLFRLFSSMIEHRGIVRRRGKNIISIPLVTETLDDTDFRREMEIFDY